LFRIIQKSSTNILEFASFFLFPLIPSLLGKKTLPTSSYLRSTK
jgi:hypothetical protein